MATTSSLGIGTGVDLQSMLSKIIAAERAPINNLESKISSTNSTISLYGTLKSKLDALRSAGETLASPIRLSAMGATSSDEKVATATASFLATQGSYTVAVTQLAAAQKSFTKAYDSGTSFGQGQLNFTVAGTPHQIDLTDKASYTIQEIRGKINDANIGVTATVVSGTDGDRLVLTGTQPGAANAFSFTTTIAAPDSVPSGSPQSALDDLETAVTAPTLAHSTAQDAIITIDGIAASSATNTFSSTVNGLTFTAKTVGTTNVTVQTDQAKITAAAKGLVDAYNEVVTLIKSNSAYDLTTKTAQAFNGDASTRSILGALTTARSAVPAALSSATLKNLREVGITIQQDGKLALDTSKLTAAVNNSAEDVTKLLGAYGTAFKDTVGSLQGSSGAVSSRLNGLNASLRSYKNQQAVLEVRVAQIEANYRKQFTALDTLVSSMTTTSNYLAQQLAGMTK